MALLIAIIVFCAIAVVVWGISNSDNAQQVAVALGSGAVFGLAVFAMVLMLPPEMWQLGGIPAISLRTPSPDEVLNAFRAAGLTVQNVTTSGEIPSGLQASAPSCTAYRFEVGIEDYGGRVISCGSRSDADRVAQYYIALGDGAAFLVSHVHTKGSLVLQMGNIIDRALFDRYVTALP